MTIIRDFGTITIGGTSIGELDPFQSECSIQIIWDKIRVRPVERGLTKKILHEGASVFVRVAAGGKTAGALKAAFPGYESAGSVAIDAASLVPGEELTSYTFAFSGRHYNLSGTVVATITEDRHNVGIPGQPQPVIFEGEFVFPDTEQFTLEPVP